MNQNDIEPLMDLGQIPFHVRVTDVPSNDSLPDLLPFGIGVRTDLRLLVQLPNPIVQQSLKVAYRQGSIIGTPMDEVGFGRDYADSFFNFVTRVLPVGNMRGLRVLEIGCGIGYLLHRLKVLGAEVLGIEPGAQGQIGAKKWGISVVRDVFPSAQVRGPFDVIIHHCVLEHLIDPGHSLELQSRHLSKGGVIILAVPDCTEYIRTGDLSIFIHEHWNYFSPVSLTALLESVGLQLLRLEKSGFGGSIYATAGPQGKPKPLDLGAQSDETKLFERRARESIQHAKAFFDEEVHNRRSVGVFCAGRMINLLQIIQPSKLPRFFDDDKRLHGKYYPPIAIPIEPRSSLLRNPVDELVIMSRSFGKKLKGELMQEKALKATHISLPDDVL